MNIFYVDRDPTLAAQALCDKHVVKMVLESAQIMCTVLHEKGLPAQYRATHKNHPCTIWAGKSEMHFSWLHTHAAALSEEYTFRYGKVHKSLAVIEDCVNALQEAANISDPFAYVGFIQPPLAMPEKYHIVGDAVQSYRSYYILDKLRSIECKWTKRKPPSWLVSHLEDN